MTTTIPATHAWVILAADMYAKGMSYNQQAVELGLVISTYQRYRMGSRPTFEMGCKILDLHQAVCGQDLTRLRLTTLFESA